MSKNLLALDRLPMRIRAAIDAGAARVICPKCDGGRSHESSLSIRSLDDGIVKLSCFRASCNWYAITLIDPDAKIHTRKVKPAVYFDEPTQTIDILADILVGEYGLDMKLVSDRGWRTGMYGKLVMPIMDAYGLEIGHVTRTFTEPKRVMTYKATAGPWLDWWRSDFHLSKTVIVEDCISAARLGGLGYNAIALMGTSVSSDQAVAIANGTVAIANVYLALDRDAFEKSLKLVARHKHILPMRPICLDEDIKNMDRDSDIYKLFGDKHGRDVTRCSNMREQRSL